MLLSAPGSVERLEQVRVRRAELSFMIDQAKAEGRPHEELDAERERLWNEWQDMVCQSREAILSASSPVFSKALYVAVPITFKWVQIVLTTSKGETLCGVRFPSSLQDPDGCIGLRYARQSSSTHARDPTRGFYHAISGGAAIAVRSSSATCHVPRAMLICHHLESHCCSMRWMQRKVGR